MAGFGMAFDARNGFVTRFVEDDFATGFVQRQQPPLVRVLVVGGLDVSVKSDLEIGLARPRGGGYIDTITPKDRRRVSQTRNRRLPPDMLTLLDIPTRRRDGLRIHSARLRSAALPPVGCGKIECDEKPKEKWRCFHAMPLLSLAVSGRKRSCQGGVFMAEG